MGNGCQVGAVGLQHDVAQLHFAHGFRQEALLEGHHAADAEDEVAQRAQFAVGRGRVRIGVEDAPQAAAAVLPDDLQRLGPRLAGVDGHGQAVLQRQVDLPPEGLRLLCPEIPAPVEVETDLAHGAERRNPFGRGLQEAFDRRQLLPPAGIAVHRRRVKPHHRNAPPGMAAAQPEQPFVAAGVDGRQQQALHAGFRGAGERLFAVGVEFGFVQVRMGICQIHSFM